ncbi:BadF/BadG/BcrA/BcrD ATPase family protein [soil metagenome]
MSVQRVALLGIDGGGTSTVAALADESGAVIGRGRAGPSNAKAIGPERAREALGDAIASAFADARLDPSPVDVACLGLAGFDRPEDRALLGHWADSVRWARQLIPANDAELVLAAGTPEGWGIALIAGTGSIAFGRTPDGRIARAGGWGPLFGDEGSAYEVAIAGLRAVARRADGRSPTAGEPDPFSERICKAVGVDAPRHLVSALYSPQWDRARLAALAPEVILAAEEDDDLSAEITDRAALDLAQMIDAVRLRLGQELMQAQSPQAREWFVGPLPIAFAGGFLLGVEPLQVKLRQTLIAHQGESLGTVQLVREPVLGAIALARRALR